MRSTGQIFFLPLPLSLSLLFLYFCLAREASISSKTILAILVNYTTVVIEFSFQLFSSFPHFFSRSSERVSEHFVLSPLFFFCRCLKFFVSCQKFIADSSSELHHYKVDTDLTNCLLTPVISSRFNFSVALFYLNNESPAAVALYQKLISLESTHGDLTTPEATSHPN